MPDQHAELELAQHYGTGSLRGAAASAFEDHLVTCDACQAEVKLAAGTRRLARDVPAPVAASSAATRGLVGVGVLLAAGLAAFVFYPRGPDPQLALLGRVVEPPAYHGVSVRDQRQLSDSLFDEAMTAYVARRYDDAAQGLRAALASGVDTIPATFFLASATLMAGRPRDAADAYARVIAAGQAAAGYLPDAHFYRARALLLLGNGDGALTELAAVSRDSDRGAAAAALADSVAQVLRR